MNNQTKIEWQGHILSIQPRIKVWRYLIDNRTHSHIGYNIFLKGTADGEDCKFSVAISEKQQLNAGFGVGDTVRGTAWTKKYPKREYADFYRAGALKCLNKVDKKIIPFPPPWITSPPDMETCEWRGARILSLSCWKGKCFQCIWANMANVTIEYDWGESQKFRFESFCYGPKSCKFYKMGRARSVPYKGTDASLDDGGLDEICTENRNWND